jgi:adenylate cyclase
LLSLSEQQAPEQAATIAIYADGLGHWRGRDFDGAAKCFEQIAAIDKPSELFLGRTNAFRKDPPGPDWDPVSALGGK